MNAQIGYKASSGWSAAVQMFNLLDRQASDIGYFYTSRLPDEPAEGIDDIHTHPQSPRSLRLILAAPIPH